LGLQKYLNGRKGKNMKRQIVIALLVIALLASAVPASAALTSTGQVGINVLLNTKITNNILNDLKTHGTVLKTVEEINALTMKVAAEELSVIRSLPYVAAANPDAERKGAPVDTVAATDFMTGLSTWDLDAINVTDPVLGRTIPYNGNGVYVAVLDTGLLDSWRQYFPETSVSACTE
jgi:hypothetical protein